MYKFSVNPFHETLAFLHEYTNDDLPGTMLKALIDKYSSVADSLSFFLEPILKMENRMVESISANKERIDFYFTPISEGDDKKVSYSLANMLFTYYAGDKPMTGAQAVALIEAMNEDEVYPILYEGLNLNDISSPDDNKSCVFSLSDFIKKVSVSGFSEKNKARIYEVSVDYMRYVRELYEIMAPVEQAFIDNIDIIEPILNAFEKKYSAISDLGEHLLKCEGMDVMEEKLILHPLVMDPCALSSIRSDYVKLMRDEMHYYLGVAVEDAMGMFSAGANTVSLTWTLRMIGDQSKFDILCYLRDKEAYGIELADKFKLSQPTISRHMNKLLSAGLIQYKSDANKLYFTQNKENIVKLIKKLAESFLGETPMGI